MNDLTPKQARFVDEYLVDLNATQAAIRAGYSAKTAAQQASRLLSNVKVQAAVAARQGRLAENAGVTVERIVAELAKLGFANMADYMGVGADGLPALDWSKLTRDQAAALVEVTVDHIARGEDEPTISRVKFKLADKRGALVDLGKHLGMFVDKHEVEVGPNLAQLVAASMKKPE